MEYDEIISCPFCGENAKLESCEIPDGNVHYTQWRVVCTGCRASGNGYTTYYDVSKNPKKDAVNFWNKRAK